MMENGNLSANLKNKIAWRRIAMQGYLKKIKAKHQTKLILALTYDIEQNPDNENLYTLQSMSHLSLLLYALGDNENALYFADIVSELDLKKYKKNVKGFSDSAATANDYKQKALALCANICKETENFEKADIYWNRYLTVRLEMDKWGEISEERSRISKKRWKRNIETGDLIEAINTTIQRYENKGNKSNAVYESCGLLAESLWMKQAGGSELYSVERLNGLIANTIAYIRANIEAVDYKVFGVKKGNLPFKELLD
jgi:hypothetical protein